MDSECSLRSKGEEKEERGMGSADLPVLKDNYEEGLPKRGGDDDDVTRLENSGGRTCGRGL